MFVQESDSFDKLGGVFVGGRRLKRAFEIVEDGEKIVVNGERGVLAFALGVDDLPAAAADGEGHLAGVLDADFVDEREEAAVAPPIFAMPAPLPPTANESMPIDATSSYPQPVCPDGSPTFGLPDETEGDPPAPGVSPLDGLDKHGYI